MKRRARWIAAIAATAIAIGWALWFATQPAPQRTTVTIPQNGADPAATPGADAEGKAAKAGATRAAASARPVHALPPSTTPIEEAVPALREYAEAGDKDAAIELSWRLSACTPHALLGTEQREKTLRDSIGRDKTDATITDEHRGFRAQNAQRQIDDDIKLRDACRALPADFRDGWLTWIDRAAESGSTAAMRGYARVAVADYFSEKDVLADVDNAIERRNKARAYLDEAIRLGDPEALRDLANAYRDSAKAEIYPVDPAKAYAYAYAGTLAGISRGNDLDRIMSETAASLDGRQLATAEAEGRRIYDKCCAAH
jgi:hypothetical protein